MRYINRRSSPFFTEGTCLIGWLLRLCWLSHLLTNTGRHYFTGCAFVDTSSALFSLRDFFLGTLTVRSATGTFLIGDLNLTLTLPDLKL